MSTGARPHARVAVAARRGPHSRAATADVGTPPRRRVVPPPPPPPPRPPCRCIGGGEKGVDGGGGGERPPTPTATRRLSASGRCAPLSPNAPAARGRRASRQGLTAAPLSAVLPCGRRRLATTRSARVSRSGSGPQGQRRRRRRRCPSPAGQPPAVGQPSEACAGRGSRHRRPCERQRGLTAAAAEGTGARRCSAVAARSTAAGTRARGRQLRPPHRPPPLFSTCAVCHRLVGTNRRRPPAPPAAGCPRVGRFNSVPPRTAAPPRTRTIGGSGRGGCRCGGGTNPRDGLPRRPVGGEALLPTTACATPWP